MRIPDRLHWDITPEQARAEQNALAKRVRAIRDFGDVTRVAGVDVGFEQENTVARAAVVVLSFPALEPLTAGVARLPVTFPYVPGLLAYRELPVIMAALTQLEQEPDLFIVDGHGLAHPRRFGIACHLAVLLDKPAIGCAKSILVGRAEMPENRVGAWQPLVDKGETIGAAVRTRLKTNPVYVSIGHRVDLASAIDFALRCTRGYRVPETTRYAHKVAGGQALDSGGGQGRLF